MFYNKELAIKIGDNLFKDYNSDGQIDIEGLKYMICDCYTKLELPVPELTNEDIEMFAQIWDIDQDTAVTQNDVENIAQKYLVDEDDDDDAKAKLLEGYEPIQVTYNSQINEPKIESIIVVTKNYHLQETTTLTYQAGQDNYEQPKQDNKQQPQIMSNIQPLAQKTDNFIYPLKTEVLQYQNYNARTQKKLELVERLFNQFQKNGFITQNEVQALLTETYKQLKMSYQITSEDVRSWMMMADKDQDGKVTLKDFQLVLLDSLVQAGIEIQ